MTFFLLFVFIGELGRGKGAKGKGKKRGVANQEN